MREMISFSELKSIARLPTPSGIALAIIKLVQKEDSTIQQVVKLVKTDPALSGRILGFANSAAFGAHRAIASIDDAALMIGIQAVRNFALGLSLVDGNRQGNCAGFDYEAYWSQSLATAVAIAALTKREPTIPAPEAFTLGLLADIGYLALASAWPETYGECFRQNKGKQLLDLEQERFSINHQTMVLMLLADWGLPTVFLDALKLSFASEITDVSRTGRLARQLIFARQCAEYCVADPASKPVLMNNLEKNTCHHAMDEAEWGTLIAEINEQWHTWGKVINIKTDIQVNQTDCKAAPKPDEPYMDLLLVDDDPMIIALLTKKLAAAGYRVSVCRDGESALDFVVKNQPHLLITDWRMHPMDGIELCKALRKTAFGKNIYMLMLTAANSEHELVNAFDAGIDDYVTKPVSIRVLLSRLHAGQRIVRLQYEIEKERREVQRYTAELIAANRRLEKMANTDMLTDLPNRRYALDRLGQEFEAGLRYKRPLSILMLDLDHFKSVNDTLGHDAGDQVLMHVARLIKQTVRTNDIPCRLGGEEFMIIAANTDGSTALQLAERIRATIEKRQPADLLLSRPMTVSIGVAGTNPAIQNYKDLMILADQALYFIKQNTRNGIHLA